MLTGNYVNKEWAMSSWTSGYVADIGYIHGFYRELTPTLLAFAALMRGQRAPDVCSPLKYCELGCGQGFSINLLAAANPQIEFFGTDFNPGHIVGAQALAAAAGTPNVHFFDQSFAELLAETSLPSFDIISLHGIYSWISSENRQTIVEFIRRRLKPGGLLYISYNALPGWAAAMPLRRLLIEHANIATGPIGPRVEAALKFVSGLKEADPNFFRAQPAVGERIDKIKTVNRNYLAHEYFNRDWTPFYHSDVVNDLDEAKLSYVGSATLLENIDPVNFSPEQQKTLADISDPGLRETIRDFMINQQFRRDVFIKGAVPLSRPEAQRIWLDTRFALSTRRADVPHKAKTSRGEVDLQLAFYAPILDALADGPQTVRELLANKAVAALNWPTIQQVLSVLVGMGQLEPTLDARNDAKRSQRTKAFNAVVMKRAEESSDLGALASPVTGGGVTVDRFTLLFIAAQSMKQQDPVNWIWSIMNAQSQRLVKDGKTLESPEDNIAHLRSLNEEFVTKRSSVLHLLGVR